MKPKFHKYHAKPCEVNGIKYPSQKEMKRHQELLLLERCGTIKDLQRQVTFRLVPSVIINGRKIPPIRYVADFTYKDLMNIKIDEMGGYKLTVEDSKGMITPVYRIKRHLMKHLFNIDILET